MAWSRNVISQHQGKRARWGSMPIRASLRSTSINRYECAHGSLTNIEEYAAVVQEISLGGRSNLIHEMMEKSFEDFSNRFLFVRRLGRAAVLLMAL
jgi:hypothetical protein